MIPLPRAAQHDLRRVELNPWALSTSLSPAMPLSPRVTRSASIYAKLAGIVLRMPEGQH
jgi:hypothetical protein